MNSEMVKDFGELVSKVADQVSPIQSALTEMEQALLAIKADNSCENSVKVMEGAMKLEGMARTFLHNVATVAHAHHDIHHGGKHQEQEISGEDLHNILFGILFGGAFNGNRH